MAVKKAVTITRRTKSAEASAGVDTLTAIAQVGWGDGGHDSSTGDVNDPDPDGTQAAGEFLVKDIENVTVNGTNAVIEVVLSADEGNGRNISSVALYDEDADPVVFVNFSPKGKDSDTIIEIDLTEEH
ncbi:hypothetical protein [Salibacterium qingdaonense]|uniref:Phage tail-collar fibre protein n=1 Tax=Salibacterium qingdaonense TaxID=266892 RepID=A0A1I4KQD4_9BACI|nr:hypothetical protein [Salibacterium qingdaonense]SFL81002.1 hypothetical protein SAMN04488054_105164 [Salibacterium qingdaonense]